LLVRGGGHGVAIEQQAFTPTSFAGHERSDTGVVGLEKWMALLKRKANISP
jgi:hypothetical protein